MLHKKIFLLLTFISALINISYLAAALDENHLPVFGFGDSATWFLEYCIGSQREAEMLCAFKNNDIETFKKNFYVTDLIEHPELIRRAALENKEEIFAIIRATYADGERIDRNYALHKKIDPLLLTTIKENNLYAAELLLSYLWNPNVTDKDKNNAMHYLATKESLTEDEEQIVRLLTAAKISLRAQNKTNNTPFHVSIQSLNANIAPFIIDEETLDITNNENKIPGDLARDKQKEFSEFVGVSRTEILKRKEKLKKAKVFLNIIEEGRKKQNAKQLAFLIEQEERLDEALIKDEKEELDNLEKKRNEIINIQQLRRKKIEALKLNNDQD